MRETDLRTEIATWKTKLEDTQKKYDETIPYFEKHVLSEWTHKKAIQKAIESFRVSDEHKKYLSTLK